MAILSFKQLKVWQKSKDLTLEVYKITDKFPKNEQYGLTSQMRRASLSIGSNIADGFGRISLKEKMRFYYIAHGSLTELHNFLIISSELKYKDKNGIDSIINKLIEVEKMLLGLIKSIGRVSK